VLRAAVVVVIHYRHAKYDRLLMKGDFSSIDQFLLASLLARPTWLPLCAMLFRPYGLVFRERDKHPSHERPCLLQPCAQFLARLAGLPRQVAAKRVLFSLLVPSAGLPASRADAAPKYRRPGCKKSRRVDLSKQLRAVLLELRDSKLLSAVRAGRSSIAGDLVFRSQAGTAIKPDNIVSPVPGTGPREGWTPPIPLS
jgi:hypothetical protein